ncbi:MAG TPA: sigma 54-interacting transcriptional regulator [Kofleriaceae bacterium]|nr:sigma 54-interacting transcriptional regulator [Kofleriaceae bacterium]
MVAEISTQVVEHSRELELRSVELRVIDGPDRGVERRLRGGLRIGTSEACDLRLTDPTVSRLHCEIQNQGGVVRIVDGGSTNGTYVDGVRVQAAELTSGTRVRLGATVLSVGSAAESYVVELSARHRFGEMIGASTEMRAMYAVLERVAPTDTSILIQGETGTGKELVARSIHDASPRAGGPFVVVDCGAIAENLIESELFGHVRGAFSGAVGDRRGLFEEADGGTLLLDEIGELPPPLQPRLLRVLERQEVRPVGSNATRQVDVRVVAATNRPLAQAVNRGTFREDLYYRLAVVEVVLPPLRARRDDLALLAEHFFRRYAGEHEPVPPGLLASLSSRAWPGNVRELRNYVERSVSLGVAQGLDAVPAGPARASEPVVPVHLPLKDARAAWTEQFERVYVEALLARTGGNVSRAAELAGVNRRSLQRLIASLGPREPGDG